jgi:tetratricopeptide (TPR) repeat protein
VSWLLLLWLFAQPQKPAKTPSPAAKPAAHTLSEDDLWALGTSEYAQDHYPQCRDAFRQLVHLSPKSGQAITMLGLCEVGAHQDDQALEHLRAGQELGADPAVDKVAKYQLATIFVRHGMFEPALGVLAQLAQSAGEKPAYFMLAGVAALWKPIPPPDVPEADRELVYLAGRAFWYAAARKSDAAAEAMQELVARYPSSPGVHYLCGSYQLSEKADRAVDEFQAELKINSSHAGALSALAAEYLRQGEPAKGLPYAHQLVAILPDALASHALLGRLLAELGDIDEGIRELEKARAIDPNHPQPHITLASLYAKQGRKEEAARERQEFLRLKDRDAHNAER